MDRVRVTKRIVRLAFFIAIALIMHFIENLLTPLFMPVLGFAPGAKIGLSNVVTLLAIIVLGYVDAGIILVLRCLFASIFGGNYFALVYSLSGGISAYIVMALLVRFAFKKVSIPAISIAGAAIHNIVQTFVASLVFSQINYILILPFLMIASVAAGLVVGFTVYFIVKYVPAKTFAEPKATVNQADNEGLSR